MMLLTSMPMWLLLMSSNSVFWIVSSSMAKMWLLALPLLWCLNRPSNPPCSRGRERLALGQTRKGHALRAQVGIYMERMANTKETEKDCTAPPGTRRNCSESGRKAWPLLSPMPSVSRRSPLGITVAMPLRVRLEPVNPV
jgi:hypothetical protein